MKSHRKAIAEMTDDELNAERESRLSATPNPVFCGKCCYAFPNGTSYLSHRRNGICEPTGTLTNGQVR